MYQDLNQSCPYIIDNGDSALVPRNQTYHMKVLGFEQLQQSPSTRKPSALLVCFKSTNSKIELIGKISNGKKTLLNKPIPTTKLTEIKSEKEAPKKYVSIETQVDSTMLVDNDIDEIFESISVDEINRRLELQKNIVTSVKLQLFDDLQVCVRFDRSGNMPLHDAVLNNNVKLVQRFSTVMAIRNISIDTCNDCNLTALQLAVISNAPIDILQLLVLTYKADTQVCDEKGNNLLHLAVLHSDSDTLAILTTLMDAYTYGNATNFEGSTPLMLTVFENDLDKMETLLRAGVNPNIGDKKSGRTALFHAVEADNLAMVKLLIEYEAYTYIKNFFGTSPHDAMFDLDNINPAIKKVILSQKLPRMRHRRRKFEVNVGNPDCKEGYVPAKQIKMF